METDQFVHRKNLEHYQRVLSETTNEAQRQSLLKLLAEEKMKGKQSSKGSS
jgi:hypothetical protein